MHERRWCHDLGLLLDDEFLATRIPLKIRVLVSGLPCFGAVIEVIIFPNVDHLVERTHIRVPEGPQFGVFFSIGMPLLETGLKLAHCAGAQCIGADFVDHGVHPLHSGLLWA